MTTQKYIFHGKPLSQAQLNKLGFRTGRIASGQLEVASNPKTPGDYTSCDRYTLEPANHQPTTNQ